MHRYVAYSRIDEEGKPAYRIHAFLETEDRDEQRAFISEWKNTEVGIRVVSLDGFRRFNPSADAEIEAFVATQTSPPQPEPDATSDVGLADAKEITLESETPAEIAAPEEFVESISTDHTASSIVEENARLTEAVSKSRPSENSDESSAAEEEETLNTTSIIETGDVDADSQESLTPTSQHASFSHQAASSGSIFQSILAAVRGNDPVRESESSDESAAVALTQDTPEVGEEHNQEEPVATGPALEQEPSLPTQSLADEESMEAIQTTNKRESLNDVKTNPFTVELRPSSLSAPIVNNEDEDEPRRRGRPLKHDKPLRTRMGFRISDEMLQEVEILCDKMGVSKTDLILQAIQSYLDQHRSLN
jgi:hypothetical protein